MIKILLNLMDSMYYLCQKYGHKPKYDLEVSLQHIRITGLFSMLSMLAMMHLSVILLNHRMNNNNVSGFIYFLLAMIIYAVLYHYYNNRWYENIEKAKKLSIIYKVIASIILIFLMLFSFLGFFISAVIRGGY